MACSRKLPQAVHPRGTIADNLVGTRSHGGGASTSSKHDTAALGILIQFLTIYSLPVGAFIIAALTFLLRFDESKDSSQLGIWQRIMKLDLIGASLTIPATVCLMLAMQWGGSTYPWNDKRVIALLVAAACLTVVLIYSQIELGDKGTFPAHLMKNRDLVCAAIFSCFFGAAFYPSVYYLAVYFQGVRGSSAFHAGIQSLPLLISASISSFGNGALISGFGYYNPCMIACMTLLVAGSACLSTLTTTTWYWRTFGCQIVTGLGIGVGFEAGIIVAQKVAPPQSIPMAIAIVSFSQTIGGTIFIAVAQSVFQLGISRGISTNAPRLDPHDLFKYGATDISTFLRSSHREDLLSQVLGSYVDGIRDVYYVVTACAAAALVAACGLRWKSIK